MPGRPSPTPGWVVVASDSWLRKASKLPKNSSMAAASSPSGLPPPSPLMFFQNKLWSTCPDRLNASDFSNPTIVSKSSLERASASLSSVVLAPLT